MGFLKMYWRVNSYSSHEYLHIQNKSIPIYYSSTPLFASLFHITIYHHLRDGLFPVCMSHMDASWYPPTSSTHTPTTQATKIMSLTIRSITSKIDSVGGSIAELLNNSLHVVEKLFATLIVSYSVTPIAISLSVYIFSIHHPR